MLRHLIPNRLFRASLVLLALCTLPVDVRAQDAFAPRPDSAALPLKPTRKIAFTTDEGTWISLDVSPDGKTVIFDLLGDLYVLPIGGGEAKRITSGMAWDCMPRWSPDGKVIAFISDRNGNDNLWTVNPDGTGLKIVTKETDFTLSSPAWTPDGEYLVARRYGPYPSPENYLTNVPLWMYHRTVGTGVELYPRKPGATTNTGVTFAPDGRLTYFASHPGGYAGSEVGRYQIMELDRKTGVSRIITTGYGSALRPLVSPDGRWLVYATRRDKETALRIRDLRTLDEQWLVTAMQRDDQEGYAPNDVLPGYAFTPDSKAVVFTSDGHIKRVDVATKQVSVIPFTARVEQELAPRINFPQRVDDGPLAVRQLMWVEQAPDGKRAVFTGVGKIWTAPLAGGAPRRLTTSPLHEYAPTISPDGKWVAFVSQSDTGGARLMKVPAEGGTPVALTPAGGSYTSIAWNPDGDKLVYVGQRQLSPLCRGCGREELAWISADGGEPHKILPTAAQRVSVIKTERDGERVYFSELLPPATPPAGMFPAPPPTAVVSVKIDGSDKRTHAKLSTTSGQTSLGPLRPSPDGKWLLYVDREDAYVTAIPDVGDGIAITFPTPSVPARRVTTEGANYVQWADGGRTIVYSFANEIARVALDRVVASPARESWGTERFTIALSVPRGAPSGSVLLRGARLVTMKGDEVIAKGDILIEKNRIAAVGRNLAAPAGARVIDVSGKTITPGLVDVHAHPVTYSDMPADDEWNIANHLAFGVTTTRNPSGNRLTFLWNELVDAGTLVGPRLYGTAAPLTTSTVDVKSYDDALHVVRRYKAQGANSLKQYLQPRRQARQWIRMAAEAEGMIATNEGESNLRADLTMVLDGYTGIEHSINVVPIRKDVIQLIAQSGTTYTPTLIVAYGAPEGELYWRNKTDMHADEKIRRFIPHEEIDRKWRRHTVVIDEDFNFPLIAQGVRDIVRAGGRAGLGSHGNQQGLGAQWELRMMASGGLTPHEVLKIATIIGSESIGLAKEIGSIEVGKLADLLVLDANPLENIDNAMKLHYVVRNGVIYNADTLDEVWPTVRKFPLFPWARDDAAYDKMKKP